jgi:hypothetical protein
LHALLAAISSLVVLPITFFGALYMAGLWRPSSVDYSRVDFTPAILILVSLSMFSGLVLLPMPTLRWYWALIAGPAIGLVSILGCFFALDFFGLP